MKNIQRFKFAHILVLSLSTCVSSECGQTCCLCSAFILTQHCIKHLLMSGHSLRNCNFNDLYFSSELRANNETHNSSGTSIPAPFYPLLCKCIWPLLEAAVKRVLNLEPAVDSVPDLTFNSCVTLGKSSPFTFKLLPWSVNTFRAGTVLFLLCRP